MNIESLGLNERQYEAVNELDRSVIVMAGAGSGKTSVLTYRIANLISKGKAHPSDVLVFTFTNKAAQVVRERLYAMDIPDIKYMWMGTFHSICSRILREHGELLGYKRNFVIYDASDQKSLVKRILKENDVAADAALIKDMISKYKNGSKLFMKDDYKEIMQLYNDELKANNAMDFDDLIKNTLEIFEAHPEVKKQYNDRFRYIHVDEYQDTNVIQFKLIKALGEHGNVFAVGDIDQSIYKWRGADIKNIQNFEKDFVGARQILLEQNYRSTSNILNAANSVISYNENRPSKNLWSDKGDGEKIRYFRAGSDREEAVFVAREILEFAGDYSNKEIAVLYRNNAQSRQVELEFKNRGIPYNVYGGHKFFERKEIKDMLAYLKLIYNPADNVSYERVINIPKRGIGATSLDKIHTFAARNNISMLEAGLRIEEVPKIRQSTKDAIIRFSKNIMSISEDIGSLGIDEIFQAVLDTTGIISALEAEMTAEADSRIDNIYEFQSYVNENAAHLDLQAFIEDVSLRTDQDDMDYEEEKVTLMTIHAAKGLEYDVVFLVGFAEDILPGSRSKEDPSALEEERRLCYVAMTRAKKLLYITNMKTRFMYGEKIMNLIPSRFLGEIPLNLLDNMGAGPIMKESGYSSDFSDSFGSDFSSWSSGGYGSGGGYGTSRGGGSNSSSGSSTTYSMEKSSGFGKKYNTGGKSSSFIKTPKARSVHSPASEKEILNFQTGDKVVHDVFGDGLVVDVEGAFIRVAFDDAGIKKFKASLAPLRKRY